VQVLLALPHSCTVAKKLCYHTVSIVGERVPHPGYSYCASCQNHQLRDQQRIMKTTQLITISLVLVSVSASTFSQWFKSSSPRPHPPGALVSQIKLHELTTVNDFVFVAFFSPTCSESKDFLDSFDQIARHFSSDKISFAKVDVKEQKTLGIVHQIDFYPTIKLFRSKSHPILYPGTLDPSRFERWVLRALKPSLSAIDSMDSEATFFCLGYFAEENYETDAFAEFEEAADLVLGDVEFGFSFDFEEFIEKVKEICALIDLPLELSLQDWILIFVASDCSHLDLVSDATSPELLNASLIAKRIQNMLLPPLGELTFETLPLFLEKQLPFVILFTRNSSESESRGILQEIRTVMDDLSGLFLFMTCNPDHYPSQFHRLFGSTLPQLVFDNHLENLSTKYSSSLHGNISSFLQLALEGKLVPDIRFQSLDQSSSSLVHQVNALTFEQEISASRLVSVVLIRSDWCAYCKVIRPLFLETARHFAYDTRLKFAEIDAGVNHVPVHPPIQRVPKILLFFPQGTNRSFEEYIPKNHIDNSALQSMISFIETKLLAKCSSGMFSFSSKDEL